MPTRLATYRGGLYRRSLGVGGSVRVLAFRRRPMRYGGTSWLGLRKLSKLDADTGTRIRRREAMADEPGKMS